MSCARLDALAHRWHSNTNDATLVHAHGVGFKSFYLTYSGASMHCLGLHVFLKFCSSIA
ncbi:hypothetical protein [Undibacterium sp.]|uniref:hypothetical protein n=1 Tax=Undibacterium sp. TaxID=1914977 RepID=UPI003750F93C